MKNRKIIVALLTLLCIMSIMSCNNGKKEIDEITVVQNFEQGKTYQFEVHKKHITFEDPNSENVKVITKVEFNVIGKKGEYKQCVWKYGLSYVEGINMSTIDDFTKMIMNSNEGLEVKFLIDDKGVFQEITNYEECKAHFEKTNRRIYENSPNKMSADEIENYMELIAPTMVNADVLVGTYCPEIMLHFRMFGMKAKLDSVSIYESEIENSFGGRNFKSQESIALDTIYTDEGIATISIKNEVSKGEFDKIIKESLGDKSLGDKKPFKDAEIPKMDLVIRSLYNYDYNNQILKESYFEKTITNGEVSNKNITTVILKN